MKTLSRIIVLCLAMVAFATMAAVTKVDVRVNPSASWLSQARASDEGTRIRFEDYVSNPQPGATDPQQGWIARFNRPFTGLAQPQATNTTRLPLPTPVGLVIESGGDSVGFYDPSSRVDCADARGDRLIFRFVDPAQPDRAATVSRVAFRLIGTSVAAGKVRFRLFDIDGKSVASGTAKIFPKPGSYESEVDCLAHSSRIHKVIVEHSPGGYFVVGNVRNPKLPDFGFDGFTVSDQPVKRTLDELIPHSHAEQWERHAEADSMTDMTRCSPASALLLACQCAIGSPTVEDLEDL